MFIAKYIRVCLYITFFSSFKHVQGQVTETRSWNLYIFFFSIFQPKWSFFCILGHVELFLSVNAPIIFSCPILPIAQVLEAISI